MLVNSFEIDKDFWKINPHMTFPKIFKELYKSGSMCKHDGNKISGSRIMWSIALIFDYDSKYNGYALLDRKKLVCTDYLDDKTFFKHRHGIKGYQELVLQYNESQMDSERRYLVMWNNKVDAITKLMERIKVDRGTIDEMIGLLGKYEMLMNQKDKIDERIKKRDEEKAIGDIRGGGDLGLLETGII